MKRIFEKLAFANVFAFILTKEHIPSMIADAMLHLTTNKYLILLLINLILLFVGMIVNDTTGIILVAPLLEENAARRRVYLPEGEWRDFFTGEAHIGPAELVCPCEGRLPVFARACFELKDTV